MANSARNFLAALLAVAAVSCYSPDLTTQIYKCDRGKCPEGLYCNDNMYCTQSVPALCAAFGLEIMPNVAVCVGASTPGDPSTICVSGATTEKCDMMMISKKLCTGPGLEPTSCAYCCK